MISSRLLLGLAALVALVATAGSLYYSELRYFPPCELCWYQRYAMYPLTLLLGLGAWYNDRKVAIYALPLALIGGSISVFHLLEQNFPDVFARECRSLVPCTVEYIPNFPIPLQALVAFVFIAASLTLVLRSRS
jgi:disulfide bond formation protein DsbB